MVYCVDSSGHFESCFFTFAMNALTCLLPMLTVCLCLFFLHAKDGEKKQAIPTDISDYLTQIDQDDEEQEEVCHCKYFFLLVLHFCYCLWHCADGWPGTAKSMDSWAVCCALSQRELNILNWIAQEAVQTLILCLASRKQWSSPLYCQWTMQKLCFWRGKYW